jgi:hypothetical protein
VVVAVLVAVLVEYFKVMRAPQVVELEHLVVVGQP